MTLLSFVLFVLFSYEASAQGIKLNAKQAFMAEAGSGIVLLEKDADQQMPPASLSKLMTTYLVFDRIKAGVLSLDDVFTVSERAWRLGGARTGGSTMFLKPRSKVTVADLIKGVIVQSGNDACIVLAEGIAGSEDEFVKMMNEGAKELGLANSQFKNSTGWPKDGHYMSARDLYILSKAMIEKFPELYETYKLKEFTYNGIKQGNRNPLLYIKGLREIADGLKTGHSEASGYGLVGSAASKGMRLIMVVNGLPSNRARSQETERLMKWGFAEFENRQLYTKGDRVTALPVWLGQQGEVSAVVDKSFFAILPKIKRKETKLSVVYDTPIKAPVKKGDRIAVLNVANPYFGDQVQSVELYAGENIEKQGYFGKYKSVIKYFFNRLKERI